MIQLKPGVRLEALTPQMSLAVSIIASVYQKHGADCTITSANDSTHSVTSLHYKGLALDFRTRDFKGDKHALTDEIERALGAEFDVVYEGDGTPNAHLHCEYDP